MKKTILAFALTLIMGSANAQIARGAYGVFSANKDFVASAAQAPAHTESLEGCTLFGYGTGVYSNLGSVGVQSKATYHAAMYIDGAGVLGGASIKGFSIPYQNKTNMKDMSIWVASVSDISNKIYTQEVDKSQINNGTYSDIALDEAVEIPSEGVYVGYSFTITKATSNPDKFPVMFDAACKDPSTLLLAWDNEPFGDYSDQFGALGIQIYLSDVNIAEEYAYFGDIAYPLTAPGKTYTFSVPVYSDASNAVSEIEYTVDVDGNTETHTAQLNIPAGIAKKGKVDIDIVGPAAIGTYEVKLQITKVNGKENSCTDIKTITFNNLERVPVRSTVVEEFTGTTCGWCPRGLAGMDLMKETYPEKFIGIGLHQYDNTDPMYIANYAKLGFSGAPSCMIDRKSGDIDPYYGTGSTILDDFEAYNSIPADVEIIDLKAIWTNEDKKSVDLESSLAFLIDGKYSVAYVLTADDVYSTKSNFKQHNYYYSNNPTGDPLIDQFCRGGEYGQSSFTWHFNDVALAGSYKSNGSLSTDALETATAGSTQTNAFTINMPTKQALLDALKYDKIYAVAIVTKNSTGEIANAFRTRVLTADEYAEGIKTVNSTDATPVAYYTIDGKAIAAPQQGINIVKMSNGTVKKVMY